MITSAAKLMFFSILRCKHIIVQFQRIPSNIPIITHFKKKVLSFKNDIKEKYGQRSRNQSKNVMANNKIYF